MRNGSGLATADLLALNSMSTTEPYAEKKISEGFTEMRCRKAPISRRQRRREGGDWEGDVSSPAD